MDGMDNMLLSNLTKTPETSKIFKFKQTKIFTSVQFRTSDVFASACDNVCRNHVSQWRSV